MRNKKGATLLHENIFTIVIVIALFLILFYFVNQQATGKLLEKQILAKEICLISLSAKSGTTVTIDHYVRYIIEKKDYGIFVNEKDAPIGKGYFYDCYGNFEINQIEDGKIEMKIKGE